MVTHQNDNTIYLTLQNCTFKVYMPTQAHPLKSTPETDPDGGKGISMCHKNALCPLTPSGTTTLAVLLQELRFDSDGRVTEISSVLINWLIAVAIGKRGCDLSKLNICKSNAKRYWGDRAAICDIKTPWQPIRKAFPKGSHGSVKRMPLDTTTFAMREPGFADRLIRATFLEKVDISSVPDFFYRNHVRKTLGVLTTRESRHDRLKRKHLCAKRVLMLSGVKENVADGMCMLAATCSNVCAALSYTGAVKTGETSPISPNIQGCKNVYTHVRISPADITPELCIGRLCDVEFDKEHYLVSASVLYFFMWMIQSPHCHVLVGHRVSSADSEKTSDPNIIQKADQLNPTQLLKKLIASTGTVTVYGDWAAAFFTPEGGFFQLLIHMAFDPTFQAISVHTARPDTAVSYGGDNVAIIVKALYHSKRQTDSINDALLSFNSIMLPERVRCVAEMQFDPLVHSAKMYRILRTTANATVFSVEH